MFDKVAARFEALDIDTLAFGSFDASDNQIPAQLTNFYSNPIILYFTGLAKDVPKVATDLRTKELMLWVQSEADFDFEVPEYSWMSEAEFRALEEGKSLEDL